MLDTVSKCVTSHGSCESQYNIHVANCLCEVDAKVFTLRKYEETYMYTANTGIKQYEKVVFIGSARETIENGGDKRIMLL